MKKKLVSEVVIIFKEATRIVLTTATIPLTSVSKRNVQGWDDFSFAMKTFLNNVIKPNCNQIKKHWLNEQSKFIYKSGLN